LVRIRFVAAAVLADFDSAMPDAVEQLNSATALAEQLKDTPLVIEGRLRLGVTLFNMGRLVDAAAELNKSSSLASAAGDTRYEARARAGLAVIDYLRGHAEEGERRGLEAKALLERTGETFFQIQNLAALAQCALARGDAAHAETQLREALAIALNEDSFLVAEVGRLLIETLIELDRLEEASQIAAFAARRVQHDQPYGQAAVEIGQAALAHAVGDLPRALGHHRTALARLEELGLRIDLGQARVAYARTLRECGDLAAAYEQLEAARMTFETTGADGLLGGVQRELEELSTATSG
jgi:tetratricopeptide (TPR) repeat protein